MVKEKFSVLNLGPGGLVEKGTLDSGIKERCWGIKKTDNNSKLLTTAQVSDKLFYGKRVIKSNKKS